MDVCNVNMYIDQRSTLKRQVQNNGDDGGTTGQGQCACDLTYTNDNCVQQGSGVPRSNTVEQHGSVEDDGIDSSELLEHHEHEGDDELRTVLRLEQVPHRVRGQVADASSLCQVLQLFLNVACSSNACQHLQENTSELQSNTQLAIETCRQPGYRHWHTS